MKMKSLLLAVPVLVLGLGVGSLLPGSAEAQGQDKKETKDKKEDKKEDKGKAVDKTKAPIPQHLIQSVEQLIKAKDALKNSVQKEASEKHLEPQVIKELQKAVEEVDKGIRYAEEAIKKNK